MPPRGHRHFPRVWQTRLWWLSIFSGVQLARGFLVGGSIHPNMLAFISAVAPATYTSAWTFAAGGWQLLVECGPRLLRTLPLHLLGYGGGCHFALQHGS